MNFPRVEYSGDKVSSGQIGRSENGMHLNLNRKISCGEISGSEISCSEIRRGEKPCISCTNISKALKMPYFKYLKNRRKFSDYTIFCSKISRSEKPLFLVKILQNH